MTPKVLLGLVLAAAGPQILLNPVSYSTTSIQGADGTEAVSLFASHVSGVDVEELSREQRVLWTDLTNRIRSTYATGNRRQRARLTVEVLELEQATLSRNDYSIWLRFPSGVTTHAERVTYPRGGTIWRLADGSSGQYVAIVRWSDGSQMPEAIREYLKTPGSVAALERVKLEGAKVEELTEALLEVNARRQYLTRGTVSPATLTAELAALLPNLFDEGRARILESLALLQVLRVGGLEAPDADLKTNAILCAVPCDADSLALPPVPRAIKLKAIAGRSAFLEPPDESVVREFFGKNGWSPADLELDFKEQAKRLLSAKQ